MPSKKETDAEPVTIKKYANRRLYNTATSTYVTLEDLAEMVKSGTDFTVHDAKTGEDITRSVLTQIIFEEENKGQNLLPIRFLQQLIRFYGDSMPGLVPSYLEFSIESLRRDQEKLQQQMTEAVGGNPFGAMEDQVRQNMAMFEQTMRMFSPFSTQPSEKNQTPPETPKETSSENASSDTDLKALRDQLSSMQQQIDSLTKKS